jgi:AcrR family transcriptional regulator
VSNTTRERLIEAALRRFYRDGFRNVGIDQICSDVSISKTAFYKHFESKDDLMLAVLDQQDAWLQEAFQQLIQARAGDSPVAQLRAVFDVVNNIVQQETFLGCIFVNACMEFPLLHEPAHQAAARNKRTVEAIVRQIAERAAVADPDALAQELCLIMEGTYVTRHVTGNPDTIKVARRIANRAIDAACGEQTAR